VKKVYRQLIALGVACDVVVPRLVPVKAGDRVKTYRRDAKKLARSQGGQSEMSAH
jgi:transposase